ncbi:MAG: multiheme c-type cytochrome [Candidatus Rokuibacteriota bacterium]
MRRSPFVLIGLAVLLMAVLVYVAGLSLWADQRDAVLLPVRAEPTPVIPFEAGVFRRQDRALAYAAMPAEPNPRRTLAVYYARRAYPGAPPVIPHQVDDAQGGGKACLSCHADGGWAPRFSAYAPVVPHPELESCRQCHVPEATKGAFRATAFSTVAPPRIRRAEMPGSPPPIPHGLQMRENCLACHAGPGAVAEVRTSHPARVNCRQCHALDAEPAPAFERPEEAGVR